MIYAETSATLVPGKMAEYQALVSKEVLPIWAKLGIKLVGSWHTTVGNTFETVALFAYDDMAQMQKQTAARNKDKDYIAVSQKAASIMLSSVTRIMEPHPWSAMK
jgi:hypothetical protein